MNIKYIQLITALFVFVSCSSKVETEFGRKCIVEGFKYEKRYFSSDINGAVKFQMDESVQKDSGKMITGVLPQISPGKSELSLEGGMNENCSDCILMFIRNNDGKSSSFKAVSGFMNVEALYYDTKGRVSFAKGYFSRMVFDQTDDGGCIVVPKIDFVFY